MRYIAIVGDRETSAAYRRVASDPSLAIRFSNDRAAILADPALPYLPIEGGVLFGDLFSRGTRTPVTDLPAGRREALRASGGRWLIMCCWGSYLALWCDAATGTMHALRAPLGRLPAYYARSEGLTLVASDAELLASAVNRRPAIDWQEVCRHLGRADLRRRGTCLAGVTELRGGERLAMDAEHRVESLWEPTTVLAQPRFDEREEAAARLRDAVRLSVTASLARCDSVLLQLSGGIDSSIVAACLAHGGTRFEAVNFRLRGRAGDEADYAQQVADRLGIKLHLAQPSIADVALDRSAAAALPSPARRGFEQAGDAVAWRLADRTGAQAIVDGGGGDNVFYAMLSIAPAAELWLREGPSRRFRETVGVLADLTNSSPWWLLWKALRCAWRGHARPATLTMLPFLSAEARDVVQSGPLHPWLDAASPLLPAQRSMIAGLAPAQCLVEGRDLRSRLPQISVLVTQPVLEVALRVDTALWFAPGQTRALARHAFARELPPQVLARRSKGTPDGFVADLFRQRRPQIRRMLLGGLLDQQNILNRPLLAEVLAEERPVTDCDFVRVMELVDAEAWARCWS